MKLIYTKAKWERGEQPLADFLADARGEGFDAVEIHVPSLTEPADEIRRRLTDQGLGLVAQITTDGPGPAEHLASLKSQLELAAQTGPLLVNCHGGRDFFSLDSGVELMQQGMEWAESLGVMLCYETHRGRPLFSVPSTVELLRRLPQLRLTADFSHWCCVHESDLTNQPEGVEAAIQRSWHIHARVGYSQGPQVPDPLGERWKDTTARFIDIWQRIIDARRSDGTPWLTVTPEFGPPLYMHCAPQTNEPLADTWTVNVEFMRHLRETLR